MVNTRITFDSLGLQKWGCPVTEKCMGELMFIKAVPVQPDLRLPVNGAKVQDDTARHGCFGVGLAEYFCCISCALMFLFISLICSAVVSAL